MALNSLAHASLRLFTPLSFSQQKLRLLRRINPPALISTGQISIMMSSRPFSRQNFVSSLPKNRTRIACMSTSTPPPSPLPHKKDDEDHQSGKKNEKVNAVVSSWIGYLPREIQPYAKLARVDKPIGTWLLLWPFAWSATLATAAGSPTDFKTLAIFTCAAPLLRGAACTINDIFDRDFDKMVERTKMRPIASGAITPFQGLCFFAFQLLLSHGILLQLANYSAIHEASLIFLMSTYPLMKRLTYWAQAYLGLFFSWGNLFGWYAIKGSLQPSIVLPLYMAGFFWIIVYDTIYAHQDKEDDIKVGVKSTALKFGDSTKQWISGFAIASLACLALTGYNARIGWPYYALLAAASGHLAWQIGTVDLSSSADCSAKFVSNKWFGALIFSGILLGRVFP